VRLLHQVRVLQQLPIDSYKQKLNFIMINISTITIKCQYLTRNHVSTIHCLTVNTISKNKNFAYIIISSTNQKWQHYLFNQQWHITTASWTSS